MTDEQPVPWLSESEFAAWRPYIVGTLKLRQRLHRELSDRHDVALVDYEVLVVLRALGPTRMSELAMQMGLTKSRLSHQVARLEEAELLRRVRDPEDKRGVVVELAEGGAALLETTAPTHLEGVREHLIDLLSPDEQAVIAAAFDRVEKHLDGLGG